MEREDLDRELEALWRRLQAPAGEDYAPPEPEQAAKGTPAVRRLESELAELRGLLEAREAAAEELKAKAVQAETEAKRARLAAEDEQDLLLEQIGGLSAMLEEAKAGYRELREKQDRELEAEKAGFEARLAELKAAQEQAFERWASEREQEQRRYKDDRERWERQQAYWKGHEARWLEKEARLHERVKHLEEELKRAQQTRDSAEGGRASAHEELARVEGSLRAALDQLETERRDALRLREEREKSEAENARLQARLAEVQASFDSERRQWRELWDREHAAWELQKKDFELWEEKLRREREAWLEAMRSKEKEGLQEASRVADFIKSVGDWAQVARSQAKPTLWKRVQAPLTVFACAGVLAVAAWQAVLWAGGLHFYPRGESALSLARPTALTVSGDRLWISEWDGGLVALSAAVPGRVERRYQLKPPYHPVSLGAAEGLLWSLDASSAAPLRHDPQDPTLTAAPFPPAPGQLPAALAFDGRALWTYDAAGRSFWRKPLSGGAALRVPAPEGLRPSSLQWAGEELWAYDAKSGELSRLALDDGKLVLKSRSQPPGRPLALAVSNGTLWTLSSSGGERHVLRAYRIWP